MKLDPNSEAHVELLARDLHEAGREAVERGLTMPRSKGVPPPFLEWAKAPEEVREGRRIQARWLLRRYRMLCD